MSRPTTSARIGLVALVGSLVAPAWAKGPGVRAGDVVVHPRAEVGVGYDDNVLYESNDDPTSPPGSAAILRVGGGLSVANRSPNKVGLELDADFAYRQFFAAEQQVDDPRIDPGVERDIEDRSGIEFIESTAVVALLPRAPVTLELVDQLRFIDRPTIDNAIVGFELLDNAVGADLRFRPGENPDSRALEMRLGYRLRTVRFLGDDTFASQRAEKTAHQARFLTLWKFLPKTALLADFEQEVNDYGQVALDPNDPTTIGPDRDSKPFRAQLGLRGLVTPRVSVVLKGGYANTFNAEGESFSGPIGTVSIQYALEPTLAVGLGYEHDGRDSAFSNFVVVDRVFAHGDLFFLGKWRLGAKVSFGLYDYSEAGRPANTDPREDPVLQAAAAVGYRMRDWLELEVSWDLEHNATDFRSPNNVASDRQDVAEYTRNIVLFAVQADY